MSSIWAPRQHHDSFDECLRSQLNCFIIEFNHKFEKMRGCGCVSSGGVFYFRSNGNRLISLWKLYFFFHKNAGEFGAAQSCEIGDLVFKPSHCNWVFRSEIASLTRVILAEKNKCRPILVQGLRRDF